MERDALPVLRDGGGALHDLDRFVVVPIDRGEPSAYSRERGAKLTHSFLTSISAHSHQTSASSSTLLNGHSVPLWKIFLALLRSASLSPEAPPCS